MSQKENADSNRPCLDDHQIYAYREEWLKGEGLTLISREHLITDAGQIAPGFTDANDQVEFFVHSPFASRLGEKGELLDRNTDSLVLYASFRIDQTITRVFFSDTPIWPKLITPRLCLLNNQ